MKAWNQNDGALAHLKCPQSGNISLQSEGQECQILQQKNRSQRMSYKTLRYKIEVYAVLWFRFTSLHCIKSALRSGISTILLLNNINTWYCMISLLFCTVWHVVLCASAEGWCGWWDGAPVCIRWDGVSCCHRIPLASAPIDHYRHLSTTRIQFNPWGIRLETRASEIQWGLLCLQGFTWSIATSTSWCAQCAHSMPYESCTLRGIEQHDFMTYFLQKGWVAWVAAEGGPSVFLRWGL